MSFQRDIAKFKIGSLKKASEARTRSAVALFTGVIKSTPVGNPDLWNVNDKAKAYAIANGYKGGSLRAAWTLSNDRASRDTPMGRIPITSDQIVNMADDRRDLFLTNNLPYARRVEYGWSKKQAPKGMVRVNFRRIKRNLKRIVAVTRTKKIL